MTTTTTDPISLLPQRILDRFWTKVGVGRPDECWLWLPRSRSGNGYARYPYNAGGGRVITVSPHRLAYTLAHGPIPAGLTVDHMCRVRICCNPAHLRLLTREENSAGSLTALTHAAKTHCPQGHPYDEVNTIRDERGWRWCRECRRATNRRYRARQKAAA